MSDSEFRTAGWLTPSTYQQLTAAAAAIDMDPDDLLNVAVLSYCQMLDIEPGQVLMLPASIVTRTGHAWAVKLVDSP